MILTRGGTTQQHQTQCTFFMFNKYYAYFVFALACVVAKAQPIMPYTDWTWNWMTNVNTGSAQDYLDLVPGVDIQQYNATLSYLSTNTTTGDGLIVLQTGVSNLVGGNVVGNIPINVKFYGAKGDGATDDRNAFQLALNAASAVGGAVYVPSGKYIVSIQVTGKGGVVATNRHNLEFGNTKAFFGDGPTNSVIFHPLPTGCTITDTGYIATNVVQADGTISATWNNIRPDASYPWCGKGTLYGVTGPGVEVHDLGFDGCWGTDATDYGGAGINVLTGIDPATVEYTYYQTFQLNPSSRSASIHLYNCEFRNCLGAIVSGSNESDAERHIDIEGITIREFGDHALYFDGASNVRIERCKFLATRAAAGTGDTEVFCSFRPVIKLIGGATESSRTNIVVRDNWLVSNWDASRTSTAWPILVQAYMNCNAANEHDPSWSNILIAGNTVENGGLLDISTSWANRNASAPEMSDVRIIDNRITGGIQLRLYGVQRYKDWTIRGNEFLSNANSTNCYIIFHPPVQVPNAVTNFWWVGNTFDLQGSSVTPRFSWVGTIGEVYFVGNRFKCNQSPAIGFGLGATGFKTLDGYSTWPSSANLPVIGRPADRLTFLGNTFDNLTNYAAVYVYRPEVADWVSGTVYPHQAAGTGSNEVYAIVHHTDGYLYKNIATTGAGDTTVPPSDAAHWELYTKGAPYMVWKGNIDLSWKYAASGIPTRYSFGNSTNEMNTWVINKFVRDESPLVLSGSGTPAAYPTNSVGLYREADYGVLYATDADSVSTSGSVKVYGKRQDGSGTTSYVTWDPTLSTFYANGGTFLQSYSASTTYPFGAWSWNDLGGWATPAANKVSVHGGNAAADAATVTLKFVDEGLTRNELRMTRGAIGLTNSAATTILVVTNTAGAPCGGTLNYTIYVNGSGSPATNAVASGVLTYAGSAITTTAFASVNDVKGTAVSSPADGVLTWTWAANVATNNVIALTLTPVTDIANNTFKVLYTIVDNSAIRLYQQ